MTYYQNMNNNFLSNAPLVSAFISMVIAQFLKPFINVLITRKLELKMLYSTGGMPSSHTSSVVALVTSVGLVKGLGSTEFAICIVFAIIVIHDAMGIRRAAGQHAEVLNEWSRILKNVSEEGKITEQNLKTLLGHTFSQVFFGGILGIIVGFFVTNVIVGV